MPNILLLREPFDGFRYDINSFSIVLAYSIFLVFGKIAVVFAYSYWLNQ